MTSALVLMLLTATPTKVASPTWKVVDVKPELAAFFAEQLAQALRAEGVTVTTADDIATLLGAERQRELLGCAESATNCMAELASALGCDATLTVSLARLGKGFRGLAKVMSSRDGSILSSAKLDAPNEEALADQLDAAAKILAAPFKPAGAPAELVGKQPASVSPRFWWVPGAAGVIAAGAGAVFFGLADRQYSILVQEEKFAVAQSAAIAGKNLQVSAWVAISVGAAAILGSVFWLLLGSTKVQPQVSLGPNGGQLGVEVRF